MGSMKRRLSKLEEERQRARETDHEADHEREERLRMIREGAERENERFFRDLVYWRRRLFLLGLSEASRAELTAEELRDENFLYADDELPFDITENGEVFCTRDGKPVTDFHQTLAEVWYWQFREWDSNPRGLIHDTEVGGYLVFSRDWCPLPNYFWALGADRACPQGITHNREPYRAP
jgi:hypothetical protein